MSSGLSVKLPFTVSETFGAYNLNTTFKQLARQNLKMLILTIPGERMMNPDFGVGLIKLLFEQAPDQSLRDAIRARIHEQVNTYMPFIRILDINFIGTGESIGADPNALQMILNYEVPSLSIVDFLDITV